MPTNREPHTSDPSETLPWVIRDWAEREPDRPLPAGSRGGGTVLRRVSRGRVAVGRRLSPGRDRARRQCPRDGAHVDIGLRSTGWEWAWLRAVRTGVNTDSEGRSLEYVLANCKAERMVCDREFLDRVAEIAPGLDLLKLVIVADAGPEDLPAHFPVPLAERGGAVGGVQAGGRSVAPAPPRNRRASVTRRARRGRPKGALALGQAVAGRPFHGHHRRGRLLLPVPGLPRLGAVAAGLVRLPGWAGSAAGVVQDPVFLGRRSSVRLHGGRADSRHDELAVGPADPTRRSGQPAPLCGGAPVVPRIEEFKARFGMKMRTNFGTTEVGVPLYAGPDVSADRASHQAKWVTPGYEVRVADDNDYAVRRGQTGELLVRNKSAVAYDGRIFRDAGKDGRGVAQRMVPHRRRRRRGRKRPLSSSSTGSSDSMRRRGENISSMEVEAYVHEHPAVSESAAIGVPSEYGEDEVKICVLLHDDQQVSHAELHDFLAARMPDFMLPRYIEFIREPGTDRSHEADHETTAPTQSAQPQHMGRQNQRHGWRTAYQLTAGGQEWGRLADESQPH